VYPFGTELHYTDAREGADAGEIAAELRRYLAGEGFGDAEVTPIAAGIEDSFMMLMGAPEGEPA
jgi:hypothetical protein